MTEKQSKLEQLAERLRKGEKAPPLLEEKLETEKTSEIPSNEKKESLSMQMTGSQETKSLEGIVSATNIQQQRQRRAKQVEKILEDGLEEIFLNMPASKQREFKKAGEQTVKEINSLLDKTKIKIKQIVSLIRKWLSIIPGINKFFLEQEAKIKADEVMKLRER